VPVSTNFTELDATLVPKSVLRLGPVFRLSWYRAFRRFRQAKFPDSGLILGSSQYSILPQLHPKTMLGLKEVKIDSKISNSRH